MDSGVNSLPMDVSQNRLFAEITHMLFNASNNGMFVVTDADRFVEVNETGCALVGYTREVLLDLALSDVLPDKSLGTRPFPTNRQGVTLRDSNGRSHTVDIEIQPMSNGRSLFIIRPAANHQTQTALYRALMEKAIPDMVWLKDPDGVYLACNPMFERLMGVKEADLLGKNDHEFFEPELADFFRHHDKQAIQSGKPSINEEWLTLADDGRRILVETIKTPTFDEQGNLLGVLGIARDITQRKIAEEALRLSQERFATSFRSSPTAIAITNLRNSKLIDVNDAWCDLVGYARKEALGQTNVQLGITTDAGRERMFNLIATKGSTRNHETTITTRSGAIRDILFSVEQLNIDGEPHLLTSFVDITERNQAQKALQESEEKYRRLFDTMLRGIVYQAADGTVTSMNPAAEHILGKSLADFQGQTSVSVQHHTLTENGDPFPGLEHPSMVALRTGQPERNVLMQVYNPREQQYRLIVINAMPLFRNGETTPYQVYTIFDDITERRKAERALQDQVRLQTQIAQIASTVPGMICSFLLRPDGSMCMPYTSPALDEIYGLDAAALAQDAAPLFAITHPEDAPHVQETINKSAQTMTLWHDEYRVRHPRKGEIWVEGHSMPQLQADGSILWHGFIQDITERKWNERAVYLMSDTQRQIAILDTPEAISQLVGAKVQEIIGDGYTGASLLDDTQQAMRISGLYGMGDLYQKLVRRFKFDITRMSFALSAMTPEELEVFGSGRLEKFEGGLYALTTRQIPRFICETVEKQLGITAVYTMGFVEHDYHLGGLTILAKRDITPYKEMIETIVHQAAVAIRRLKSEQALRDSEERYHRTLDNMLEGCQIIGFDWRYLYLNASVLQHGRRNKAELLGRTMMEAYPGIETTPLFTYLSRAMTERTVQRIENEFRYNDGSTAWFDLSIQPVPDGLFILSIDITERKQAETALQELAENMAAAQQITHSGSWEVRLTPDLEFIEPQMWSDECYRIFGVEPGSIPISRELFYSRVHPDDRDRAWQTLWQVIQDGSETTYEYRLVRPDGSIRTLYDRVKCVVDPNNGRAVKIVGMVQDVTESREAEALISELNRRMELILNSAGEGLYGTDIDGRITFVNPAMAQMVGWETADMLGQNAHNLFHHTTADGRVRPQEECSIHLAMLADRSCHADDELYWHKNGEPLVVEFTSTPIREDGQILGMVVVVKDITERQRAKEEQAKLEEQLRQAQKMESIGRLASGVAHDFNNQLTIIQIYSDLIRASMAEDNPLLPKLEQISQATEQAANLTGQLLAFSRKQMLQPTIINLNDLVQNLQSMLARLVGEDITFATMLQPDLWPVMIDPSQIEQVVMNLVVNARDAMPTGGLLSIETSNLILDEQISSIHLDAPIGPCVLLAITDTGHGMDKITMNQIFEPFFTTKQAGQGTGLGLATVHGIVKQSGGAIFVYSEPGHGTTFKVCLPATGSIAEQQAGNSLATSTPRHGNETILLVEDEQALRNLVRFTLEEMGYTILEAEDATQALELAATHPEHIDLLLTDVVMPQMSGRELAETITTQRPDIKVLFMSGYMDDAVVRHGLLMAEVNFLPKPFSHSALALKVRGVLDDDN